jgi:hypothetical protein
MARRRKLQLVDEPAGCGGEESANTDEAALRPIIPLPMLNSHGQAAAH